MNEERPRSRRGRSLHYPVSHKSPEMANGGGGGGDDPSFTKLSALSSLSLAVNGDGRGSEREIETSIFTYLKY